MLSNASTRTVRASSRSALSWTGQRALKTDFDLLTLFPILFALLSVPVQAEAQATRLPPAAPRCQYRSSPRLSGSLQAQTRSKAQNASPMRSLKQVPRWQPADFRFTIPSTPTNPFTVQFSADINGPRGLTLILPGFYDGDGTWKVRFAPPVEGLWSITTHSDVADLNGRQTSLICIPNKSANVHGGIQVDPQHPHHFLYQDGTRWLPMGYECDWLWALDMKDPTLKTVRPFLDKIAAAAFNFVLLNTVAYDTSWRPGHSSADDYGPPPLEAWEGTHENPDHSRFNLAYWRHFDQVIDALFQRGIVAHLFLKVYNKKVNWPQPGSADDDRYFRWVIARYAAYPNVTWDLSKEANNEKSLAYKLDRLKFMRANDAYRRLLTVHDDHATYNQGTYNGLLDYRSDQQHTDWHETMRAHLAQNPWPVINVEFGYEHGPKGLADKTYSVAQTPEEVARRAWEISMAGGYTAYYYTYTAWDVLRPGDTPPGYAYFKNLHTFFSATHNWLLAPADELVTNGYCLANPGREYVVFQTQAAPFTLLLKGLSSPLKAEWFAPFSGKRRDAGTLRNGVAALTPPSEFGTGLISLHVWSPMRFQGSQ